MKQDLWRSRSEQYRLGAPDKNVTEINIGRETFLAAGTDGGKAGMGRNVSDIALIFTSLHPSTLYQNCVVSFVQQIEKRGPELRGPISRLSVINSDQSVE